MMNQSLVSEVARLLTEGQLATVRCPCNIGEDCDEGVPGCYLFPDPTLRHLLPAVPTPCPPCDGSGLVDSVDPRRSLLPSRCSDCNGSGWYTGPVTFTVPACSAKEFHSADNPGETCPVGLQRRVEQVLPIVDDVDAIPESPACIERTDTRLNLWPEGNNDFATDVSHLLPLTEWAPGGHALLVTNLEIAL